MRSVYCLGAILIWLLCGSASAASQRLAPEGVWLHSNERIKVKIAPCGERLCGRIVWLKNPNDETGAARSDPNNPNEAKRGRLVMGMTVIRGLVRAGPNLWTGGTIYNPDDGEAYSAQVTVVSPDTLEVRAYILLPIFGESQLWTRAQE